MRKLKLMNINLGTSIWDSFAPISVNQYTFKCNARVSQNGSATVYTQAMIRSEMRVHNQNAFVEFEGAQKPSIIYSRKGVVGLIEGRRGFRERKFLEDIMVLGSILSGSNWFLYGHRTFSNFPCVPSNHLEKVYRDSKQCKQFLKIAIQSLQSSRWQHQFENGFHLRMLINHSNVHNREARFLANVVLWEWLYPHLRNPSGATPNDETDNLHEIFAYILRQYWPNLINNQIFSSGRVNGRSKNIYFVLRNQLAHSAKLPVDRDYSEEWMKQLPWDKNELPRRTSIIDYLNFFDRLTQVVVLKTLGIHLPDDIHSEFFQKMKLFLQSGKIGF